MFDKKLYWKRRKNVTIIKNKDDEIISAIPAPLRGQGSISKPQTVPNDTAKVVLFPGGKFRAMNRKQRRTKIRDRRFTKKGYTFGIKTNSREYDLIHRIAKRQSE